MCFKNKSQKIIFLSAIFLSSSFILGMNRDNNIENKNNNVLEKFERFNKLPKDLQNEVLRYINLKDIRNFKLVSKEFNKIAQVVFNEKKIVADKLGLELLEILSVSHLAHLVDLERIINSGRANLNIQVDKFGRRTALMLVCLMRNIYLVKLLIKHSLNLNLQDFNGDTALMFASNEGNEEIVKCLVNAGANCFLKSKHDYDALDLAYNDNIKKIIQDGMNTKKNNNKSKIEKKLEPKPESKCNLM